MPKKVSNELLIEPGSDPLVEITGEGSATYIRFRRGMKPVRTIQVRKWPHLAIDVGRGNVVIGVEAIGLRELTIDTVIRKAGLRARAQTLARARYVHVAPARWRHIARRSRARRD